MDSLKDSEVIMNWKLLKLIRFNRLIDPHGKKIYGYNISRLTFSIIIAINYTLIIYSNLGFFVNVDYKLSTVEFFILLFVEMQFVLNFFKTFIFFYRLDKIVYMLDVARIEFLTSRPCRKNNKILNVYRNRIKKYTDSYSILITVVVNQWILTAFLTHVFLTDGIVNNNTRSPNIINMPFPISTHTYNQYYFCFFIIEMFFLISSLYCANMIDIVILSYGWILSFQYELLCLGFKVLGHGNTQMENDNGHMDIKILLSDQNKLFLKLKPYHEFSRGISLTHVAFTSGSIIVLAFTFIFVYSSSEMFSILQLVKIAFGDLFLSIQLYLYCQSFDNLNHKRDSVNFGIYSSDWTSMNLKSKKLLLLAMGINTTNRFQLKVSPQRIVNLQLFSSVLATCYNIVSVMVKTLGKKN